MKFFTEQITSKPGLEGIEGRGRMVGDWRFWGKLGMEGEFFFTELIPSKPGLEGVDGDGGRGWMEGGGGKDVTVSWDPGEAGYTASNFIKLNTSRDNPKWIVHRSWGRHFYKETVTQPLPLALIF